MHENQLPHLSPAASRDGASCVSAPSPARVRTRAIRIAQSLHASAKAKLACRTGQGTTMEATGAPVDETDWWPEVAPVECSDKIAPIRHVCSLLLPYQNFLPLAKHIIAVRAG